MLRRPQLAVHAGTRLPHTSYSSWYRYLYCSTKHKANGTGTSRSGLWLVYSMNIPGYSTSTRTCDIYGSYGVLHHKAQVEKSFDAAWAMLTPCA